MLLPLKNSVLTGCLSMKQTSLRTLLCLQKCAMSAVSTQAQRRKVKICSLSANIWTRKRIIMAYVLQPARRFPTPWPSCTQWCAISRTIRWKVSTWPTLTVGRLTLAKPLQRWNWRQREPATARKRALQSSAICRNWLTFGGRRQIFRPPICLISSARKWNTTM